MPPDIAAVSVCLGPTLLLEAQPVAVTWIAFHQLILACHLQRFLRKGNLAKMRLLYCLVQASVLEVKP